MNIMSGRGRGMQLTRPAWMQDHRQPAPSVSRRPHDSPPADWVRARSQDGRPYWYSLSSGQTTWNDPNSVQKDPSKPNSNNADSPATHSTQWKKLQTQDGKIYYYNATTKQTQWTLPEELSSRANTQTSTAAFGQSAREPSIPAVEPRRTSAPQPLPQGWVEHRAPDGRTYYYHSGTRETRWERPAILSQATHRPQQLSEAPLPSGVPDLSKHHERPTILPSGWAENVTADGRTYYYNKITRETSWSVPSVEPDLKRPRIAATADLRNIVNLAREQRDESNVGTDTAKGLVRRPRSSEGKPLSDKAAEQHYLRRAKLKSDSLRSQTEAVKAESDVTELSGERGQIEEQKFQDMLKDNGVGEKTSWLEAMSRCTGDYRYLLVEPYGLRKHVWMKYNQKLAKRRRRNGILKRRRTAEEFQQLLGATFEDEPYTVLSLNRCHPEAVRRLEADARYQAIDQRERVALIKSFFSARARKGAAEQAKRRRKALDKVRSALDERIHPSLRNPKERTDDAHSKGALAPGSPAQAQSTTEAVVKATVSQNRESTLQYFDDLTSTHELERFVRGVPESSVIDENDLMGLLRNWRRNLHSLAREKKAQEREAKRAQQREYRAAFRSGVETMILSGRLSIYPRWKDVRETVAKESFARTETELGALPVDLFEDGVRLFEDRVQSHREEFKRRLKDSKIEVTESTTIQDLQKTEGVAGFMETVEASVATALLSDRQRKESKRKQREKDRALNDFDVLLRGFDAPPTTSFGEAQVTWKEDSVYIELEKILGVDSLRRAYDDFMQWRKGKEEKRVKRKYEQSHGATYEPPGLPIQENVKRARVSMVNHDSVRFNPAPQQEEDNGWAAAVSAKPVNEATKLEERERRKREILESLNST